jgi:hypothetical protein
MSGCASGQKGNPISWGEWTKDCQRTFTAQNRQGNVPADTEIPGWAKLDVAVSLPLSFSEPILLTCVCSP